MLRVLLTLLALFPLSAYAGDDAPAKTASPPTQLAKRATNGILAAGVYWHSYATCRDCKRPKAMAAVVVSSTVEARALLRTAPDGLPLGYPFVVHTEELGIRRPSGIAVVYGLFRARKAARRLRGALRRKVPAVKVFGVPKEQGRVAQHRISRVVLGETAQAYSRAAIEKEQKARYTEPAELVKKLTPVCAVNSDAIHLAKRGEWEWYQWAPVTCPNGDVAWIRWQESMMGWAAIVPSTGGYRLRIVDAVYCDVPDIMQWTLTASGRGEVVPILTTGNDGC